MAAELPYRTPPRDRLPPAPRLARVLRAWAWSHWLHAVRRYLGGRWYKNYSAHACGVCGCCHGGTYAYSQTLVPNRWSLVHVANEFPPRWSWSDGS